MSKQEILRCSGMNTAGRNGLHHFSMELYRSEALLILGNCASGKEIFKKILIGQETDYEGRMYWNEKRIGHKRLQEIIQSHEIFYANPDVVLINSYTAAENIYVMRSERRGIMPSKKAMYMQAGELFRELGLSIDPRVRVGGLDYFDRLLLCIAKAVSYESRVVLFDSMDNTLMLHNLTPLRTMLESQKKKEMAFIIFGEKFDEIAPFGDRILIMSGGRDKKTAGTDEIDKEEIPYYWLGEAYDGRSRQEHTGGYSGVRGGGWECRGKNILGVFDKDWNSSADTGDYLRRIYEADGERLRDYDAFFEAVRAGGKEQKRRTAYVENREYDKLLRDIPLAESLLLPRNIREIFSRINRIKEALMVEEFYGQFGFLQNRSHNYSDYFFYKLLAIYRLERFHKEVLLLDNPFLQLDMAEENCLREYLFRLSEKTKLIIISHRLRELDRAVGTVLYVEEGRIVRVEKKNREP